MASQAIDFALDQGLRIFPVSRASKKPIIKRWPERATDNRDLVERWGERFPQCNWAAETGEVSDLVAVDVDGSKGRESLADLQRKFGPLPATLSQRTGRDDGGQQLCYRWPAGRDIHNSASMIAPGIDIRAWHGFVIIPDSVHAKTGRRYEWENYRDRTELPESWLDLIEDTWLRSHKKKEPDAPERDNALEPDASLAPRDGLDANPRLYGFRALLPGKRTNGLLRSLGKLQRKGIAPELIKVILLAENIERCLPPLPEQKVLAMVDYATQRYAPFAGEDPLQAAWSRLSFCDDATTAFKFRHLAAALQRSRPDSPVLLPQKRIATLLDVGQRVVSRICQTSVASGFLQKVGAYVPHEKAQAFRVHIESSGTAKKKPIETPYSSGGTDRWTRTA